MKFPKGKVAFLVTRNINKFNEAKLVLAEFGITTAMLNIEAIEIQNDDLEEIAKTSALDAAKKCNLPIIVEDAGLFIKALNGFPGPYSAYVNKTIGFNGILKLMEGITNREAYFESVIAYYESGMNTPICFHGRVDGSIALEARGESGFGFDPIFIPSEGNGRTFAEMGTEKKNEFSHRAKALRKFAEWYKKHF